MKGILSIYMLQILCCACAYQNNNAGLKSVPHEEIADNDTVINLDYNIIRDLAANEFSVYTDLVKVSLSRNRIAVIDPSAFNGTQLEYLNLKFNPLVDGLDLSAVSTTLKTLYLANNDFTAFPYIPMSGTGTHLTFTNQAYIADGNISTVCNLNSFYWPSSGLRNIPNFLCQSSTLYQLKLRQNDISENSDFMTLELLSSLEQLGLDWNKFAQFPKLPGVTRKSLKLLQLANNQISLISDDAIRGYQNLRGLHLDNNQITAIPSQLLSLSRAINLSNNSLADWDVCKWDSMLSAATSLKKLELTATINNLLWLPDISLSLCTRSQHLTILLKSIPGPCDCSLQWLADVIHRGCTVEIQTDALQCGLQIQDLNLTCPKTCIIFYTQNGSFTIQDNAWISQSGSLTSMTVLGEQAWVLYSSRSFALTAPHRILPPGRYPEGLHGFDPLAAGPYTPPLSVPPGLVDPNCSWDNRLKLFDDDPTTCLRVYPGVWKMNVTSDEPVHQLHIITRNMDCRERFHVEVSVIVYDRCKTVHPCELRSYSHLDKTGAVIECKYTVSQVTGTLTVRLAAIYETSICSLSYN